MDKLGLRRDIDLALHLPLRYEDETRISPIADAPDGEPVQVQGTVVEAHIESRTRRQLLVRISDAGQAADADAPAASPAQYSPGHHHGQGVGQPHHSDPHSLLLRFIHFYPSHQKTLAVGAQVRVRGEARVGFFGREMVHPQFKVADASTPLSSALTPVYPTSAQLPQAYLRKAVAAALKRAPLDELLPPGTVPAGLPTLRAALQRLHQPPAGEALEALDDRSHPAWQRLKFEELLAQQLSQLSSQRERALLQAPLLRAVPGGLHAQLLGVLPFALTAAQQRVGREIAADLGQQREGVNAELDRARHGASAVPDRACHGASAVPMHRLLQGDVGSGKTVVAALAATLAIDSGWQCALMAPTELLAEQHFRKLVQWLEPLLVVRGQSIAWLTGSRKGKARQQMVDRVASGQAALVVGTQAVIQAAVQFKSLGLAIIDEQHRFGVAQRLALRRKLASQQLEPHLLMMSATPIPRTLAMTYFADLDVSTIDELPPGRTPVLTKLFAEHRRDEVIQRITQEVANGRQVYWVCPLIEESETLDLQNATEAHAELAAALPGAQVGLLHGRLPSAEKTAEIGRAHV